MKKISVIIPVFSEEEIIEDTVRALMQLPGTGPHEIIVVDGDEDGGTLARITEPRVIKLISAKGRAVQMNRGAQDATGDVLLFLHADTSLPPNGLEKIRETMASGRYSAGAFNYSLKTGSLFLKHLYYTSYLRSCISRIPYGDQAIFISKTAFHQLGGYPKIPIMEDVALMKQLKKKKLKVRILPEKVTTSTRRYEQEGYIYGWLRNHKLRILYHLGIPPERLVKRYPDVRGKETIPVKTTALILFLKHPQKGRVKTRLAIALGEDRTLELYTCFLRDMEKKLSALPYPLFFFVCPAEQVEAAKTFLHSSRVFPQTGETLGDRMKNAFETIFRFGFGSCILMGTDSPDLPAEIPVQAAQLLGKRGAVFGPTSDGGYYLVGFRQDRFCTRVFTDPSIPWSSETVFQRTMDILQEENADTALVDLWHDVDVIGDLYDFYRRNRDSDFKDSTTMEFLKALNLDWHDEKMT